MIIDLFLAIVALGGSAFLGFLIGKKMLTDKYESELIQLNQAYEASKERELEATTLLTRCTKRRRASDRKIVDLNAKINSLESAATPLPEPKAMPKKAPVATPSPVPKPKSQPKKIVSKVSSKPTKASQDEVLDRIKAKAELIDFDRIGRSEKNEKDDLKLIKGVGPFIEKKLNALGIYTFDQVSKFNQDDETKVNEAIEFFPGRIRRDGWVVQAKDLKMKNSNV